MAVDQKAFLEGFLQYLQSYYGVAGKPKPSTMYSNKPTIPLFDETGGQEIPNFAPPQPGMQGQQPGGMQGGGMQPGLPQETGDLSSELNTMFPRRDMARMN